MANHVKKDRQYSEYQKKIIKDYYDNNKTIKIQRLGEIVSNLYLETSKKRIELAWKRIRKMLYDLNLSEYQIECIVNEKDIERLSKTIATLFISH